MHLTLSAHVLDQYLQVAQVMLAPDGVRVELRLIPGSQMAARILPLIDTNGDGKILHTEEQAYAQRVLKDVTLEVDGHRVPLTMTKLQFPSLSEMNEGNGAIRLYLTAEAGLNTAGTHQLSFRNNHMPELGVYLANAIIPATNEIKITGQTRDRLQHNLQISFQTIPVATRDRLRVKDIFFIFVFGLCLVLLLLIWKSSHRLFTVWD